MTPDEATDLLKRGWYEIPPLSEEGEERPFVIPMISPEELRELVNNYVTSERKVTSLLAEREGYRHTRELDNAMTGDLWHEYRLAMNRIEELCREVDRLRGVVDGQIDEIEALRRPEGMVVGYVACWHEENGLHCRMPTGHEGEHGRA